MWIEVFSIWPTHPCGLTFSLWDISNMGESSDSNRFEVKFKMLQVTCEVWRREKGQPWGRSLPLFSLYPQSPRKCLWKSKTGKSLWWSLADPLYRPHILPAPGAAIKWHKKCICSEWHGRWPLPSDFWGSHGLRLEWGISFCRKVSSRQYLAFSASVALLSQKRILGADKPWNKTAFV